MSSRHIPDAIRQAAVADYKASGEPYRVVAARHGISTSALNVLVRGKKSQKRGPKTWDDDIALEGGRWVLDPVARIQRWVR